MDAVSEILVDRSRDADRLSRMVMVSLAAHVAIIGALAFTPSMSTQQDQSRVMTISLGGAEGPDQGRNPISARQIQQAVPESAKPIVTPPAPPKPVMVEPVKTAPAASKANTKPEPPKTTPQLQSRTPSQGAEVTKGTARVETNSTTQSPFGGLATAGGGAGAAYTDYADFCCPEYLAQVTAMIKRNWQPRQPQKGTNTVKFTIRRDGTIENVTIHESATPLLNLASQRALQTTGKVPPLPAAFTPPQLTMYVQFEYLQ